LKFKQRCFRALRSYFDEKVRRHNQQTLVLSFYKCQLATKALGQLKANVKSQIERRETHANEFSLKKVAAVFSALRQKTVEKRLRTGLLSGP
jgi:hypothetical protein